MNKIAIDKNVFNWLNSMSWVEFEFIKCKVKCKESTCKNIKNVYIIDIWLIRELVGDLVEDFE